MSGIIGSYHNIRGSGIVNKLGTDGQVFTSTGVGGTAGFEDAAGGGAWTLIKTETASSSSAITFIHGTSDVTFDSTYNMYCIIGQSIVTADDNKALLITTTNDGSNYESSYKLAEGRTFSSGTHNAGQSSQDVAYIGGLGEFGNASGENGSIQIWIPSPSVAGTFHTVYGTAVCADDAANVRANYFAGQHQTAEAYTGIKFTMTSGNIASGTFSLFGIST